LPVLVLLLVQINALRYQSQLITWVQRIGLLLDLAALVWFFHRNPLKGSLPERIAGRAPFRPLAGLLILPAILVGLNLAYLNVVPANADVRLVHYGQRQEDDVSPPSPTLRHYMRDVVSQPIDVVLCPFLSWGCRYLRVGDRTLVDHAWDDKAIVDLRSGGTDRQKALAAIEGLVLRGRSLRFAVLDDSSLFAADLTDADMQQASLKRALLQRAYLGVARLQGANLQDAQLQGATLSKAPTWQTRSCKARTWDTRICKAQG
jgi:hypothetical protein